MRLLTNPPCLELDLRVDLPAPLGSLAQQAAGYRFVVASCLAVSRCADVTTWGISDDHSWLLKMFPGYGDTLLFDRRGDPKLAYAAVIAALRFEKPSSRIHSVTTKKGRKTPNSALTSCCNAFMRLH
ncbi:endo-1,4-beta-xylanase (plasmid) [Bradyrhizobium sp. CCGUVB1N3]|uniref:endo-1,4-beta-xylanase n=1 Tax=Bradyrhizobium sp. CCGUVB1N3 TaxID=2949629 RepID=UPI0020B43FCA|nr:endo-1,4-beta-xylanase [Bradyrhizobium sp. CCGUVB1N3]MCP3477762.1 endo-1,4-beta-xylanase [Bradyrhizobium sp. CCGUVB1N3]